MNEMRLQKIRSEIQNVQNAVNGAYNNAVAIFDLAIEDGEDNLTDRESMLLDALDYIKDLLEPYRN